MQKQLYIICRKKPERALDFVMVGCPRQHAQGYEAIKSRPLNEPCQAVFGYVRYNKLGHTIRFITNSLCRRTACDEQSRYGKRSTEMTQLLGAFCVRFYFVCGVSSGYFSNHLFLLFYVYSRTVSAVVGWCGGIYGLELL